MSCLKKSIFSITCDRMNQYIKEKKTFPEFGGLNLSTSAQDLDSTLDLFPGTELNKTCATKPGMKQLTILCTGEAVNFDNMDAEKAEELIAVATSIATLRKVRLNVVMPITRRKSLQRFLEKRKDRISSNAPYSSKQAAYEERRSNVVMPVARRKSLQHFLQKRKHRISSNTAPYSSKQAAYDDKSWLQLSL